MAPREYENIIICALCQSKEQLQTAFSFLPLFGSVSYVVYQNDKSSKLTALNCTQHFSLPPGRIVTHLGSY